MARSGEQYKLFDTETRLPSGLVYMPDFITPEEEEMLVMFIGALPLAHATGGENGEYEAKRRWAHFGWGYDFKQEILKPGPPLPRFLQRFSHRIEKWRGWERGRVVEALVNEYTPGTPLGYHRDNEKFEHVIGISLAGWCTIKFRPLKMVDRKPEATIALELEPRSAYVMQDDIRWGYQHSVAATKTLRYSITFRTLPSGMKIPTAKGARR